MENLTPVASHLQPLFMGLASVVLAIGLYVAFSVQNFVRDGAGKLQLPWFVASVSSFALSFWAWIMILISGLAMPGLVQPRLELTLVVLVLTVPAALLPVYYSTKHKVGPLDAIIGGPLTAFTWIATLLVAFHTMGLPLTIDPTSAGMATAYLCVLVALGIWTANIPALKTLPGRNLINGVLFSLSSLVTFWLLGRGVFYAPDALAALETTAGGSSLMNLAILVAIILSSIPLFASALGQSRGAVEVKS